jgi:GH24 family phage-related lysozyme (muramidase)
MNRLFDISQEIETYKKTGSSFQMGISQAFGAVNYEVRWEANILRQTSSMVCWATVATMLLNHRHRMSMSVENRMLEVGQKYYNFVKANSGLSTQEKTDFIRSAGMEFLYPQSLSVEGWENLLRQYGPIWVTTNESPGHGFSIHARILIAIKGDGTTNGTKMTFIDPGDGQKHTETFGQFLQKYESEARTTNNPLRIQIVHLKPAHAQSQSWSYAHEVESYALSPTNSLQISTSGLDLISNFEGFSGTLYDDQAGLCTIGFGHLVHRGRCGTNFTAEAPYLNGITRTDALALLRQDAQSAARTVNSNVTIALNQNQFDALTSLVFNIGSGSFSSSTLLRHLNAGRIDSAANEFPRWNKVRINGVLQPSQGLTNRRQAERALFLTPIVSSTKSLFFDLSSETEEYVVPSRDNLLSGAASYAGQFTAIDQYRSIAAKNLTIGEAMEIVANYERNNPGLVLSAPRQDLPRLEADIASINSQNLYNERTNKRTNKSIFLKPVVHNIAFKYNGAGHKRAPAQNTPYIHVDPRHAVGIIRLAEYLSTKNVIEVHHSGVNFDSAHTRNDNHGQGRGFDFVGVKLNDGSLIYVNEDWYDKPVPVLNASELPTNQLSASKNWPSKTFPRLWFRLDFNTNPNVAHARTFFRELYEFISTQYESANADEIGLHSSIMHPDHPTAKPGTKNGREAHHSHIHFNIGPTGSE